MIIDLQNVFDDNAEHLTTEASDNVIDLRAIRNVGVGENLYVVVRVTTAFTDAGSDSTMTLTIETDDNEAFGSATTAQTIGTFGATSAAGSELIARIQPGVMNERYARLKYTVANGDLSTGKFDAFLVKDIDQFTAYPKGYTITNG